MIRLIALIVVLATFGAIATTALSCGAARGLRDRITGATPRPTMAPTFTPTVTPTATPIPTPTPELPPNPTGLERWDIAPIPYCISSNGDGYVSRDLFVLSVQRAFEAWGVPVEYTGGCGAPTQGDNVNSIGWGVLNHVPNGVVYEAGLTKRTRSECRANCKRDDTVKLVEADIIIDTSPPAEFRTATCLYATMLHEIGHFLGLEHLPGPAVMEAETSDCRTQLTDADRQALIARYGPRAHPQ